MIFAFNYYLLIDKFFSERAQKHFPIKESIFASFVSLLTQWRAASPSTVCFRWAE